MESAWKCSLARELSIECSIPLNGHEEGGGEDENNNSPAELPRRDHYRALRVWPAGWPPRHPRSSKPDPAELSKTAYGASQKSRKRAEPAGTLQVASQERPLSAGSQSDCWRTFLLRKQQEFPSSGRTCAAAGKWPSRNGIISLEEPRRAARQLLRAERFGWRSLFAALCVRRITQQAELWPERRASLTQRQVEVK